MHHVPSNRVALIALIASVFLVAGASTSPGAFGLRNASNAPAFQATPGAPNGVQLVFQVETRDDKMPTHEQIQVLRKIVEDRAKSTGADNLTVRAEGTNRIITQFTSVGDLPGIMRIIQKRGFLEFVDGGDTPLQIGDLICTTEGGCPSNEPIITDVPFDDTEVTSKTGLETPSVQPTASSKVWTTVVGGDEINGGEAKVVFNNGLPQVSFKLNDAGAENLANFTRDNIGKYMPIVLDNKVLSSPVIKGAIPGGTGVIEGMTVSDASALAVQLRSGALPLRIKLVKSSIVSIAPPQDSSGWVLIGATLGTVIAVIMVILFFSMRSRRTRLK